MPSKEVVIAGLLGVTGVGLYGYVWFRDYQYRKRQEQIAKARALLAQEKKDKAEWDAFMFKVKAAGVVMAALAAWYVGYRVRKFFSAPPKPVRAIRA